MSLSPLARTMSKALLLLAFDFSEMVIIMLANDLFKINLLV